MLPKGSLRLLLTISIFIPVLSFLVWFNIEGRLKYETLSSITMFISFFGFFIFWAFVRLFLWVQDGYKDENKINN